MKKRGIEHPILTESMGKINFSSLVLNDTFSNKMLSNSINKLFMFKCYF